MTRGHGEVEMRSSGCLEPVVGWKVDVDTPQQNCLMLGSTLLHPDVSHLPVDIAVCILCVVDGLFCLSAIISGFLSAALFLTFLLPQYLLFLMLFLCTLFFAFL